MTDSEYMQELNVLADLSQSHGWAIVCRYLDALAVEAYENMKGCQSSNNTVMAGFAREFTRRKQIVESVKGFVADKFQERERMRLEELEQMERDRLIQQLGEQSEHSTDNA